MSALRADDRRCDTAPPRLAWARYAVALLVSASLSCAFCGSETMHTSKAVEKSVPTLGQTQPTDVVDAPKGVVLEQGPCPTGSFLSTEKRCVPLRWHCSPSYYAGGTADGCDCNCGAPDPDCDDEHAQTFCYKLGRTIAVPSCASCNDPG